MHDVALTCCLSRELTPEPIMLLSNAPIMLRDIYPKHASTICDPILENQS